MGQDVDGEDGSGGGDGDGGDESSSGLSPGASAGIGVGAAVAVLGIVAAVFFLLRRRKQKNARAGDAAIGDKYSGGTTGTPVYEAPTKDTGAQEVDGTRQTSPSELDAGHAFPRTPYSDNPTTSPAPVSTVSPFSPDGGKVGHYPEFENR